MEKRYRALRIIGTIYKVLGLITGVLTILAVLAVCALSVLGGAAMENVGREIGTDTGLAGLSSGLLGGIVLGLFAAIYGGGIAVTLIAFGEGIYLLLALEENTRATATLLRQREQ